MVMLKTDVSAPSWVVAEMYSRFQAGVTENASEAEPRESAILAGLGLLTNRLKQHRYEPGIDTD
jgi:hypothetical protein